MPSTAFTGRKKSEHVDCRLIVRRVKRHQQLASDGTGQGELFATHRHHAFIANSTLSMIEADERHRDHAIIEQTIAELKEGPLAHLPSGKYTANAAWVACAVLAFNLARATAVAADMAKARWASLRKKIIKIPARIATTARRLDLHLPRDWPWGNAVGRPADMHARPPPGHEYRPGLAALQRARRRRSSLGPARAHQGCSGNWTP